MTLRGIITPLLALALSVSVAFAQGTNQGSSPLTGAKGGTNNAFMQFTGPASSLKTYTLPNASDTIATLTATQTLTNKTLTAPVMTGSSIIPTIVGGTSAGSSISMQSTNNGVPSGDFVSITGSTITLKAFSGSSTSITLGIPGSSLAQLLFSGNTSGTTTVRPAAAASGTLTLPAATDTLVGKATTDTFTNKTYDTAGAGNSFSINGLAATANTGTGAVVRAASPTFTGTLTAATLVATTVNGNTITSSSGTLTLAAGKTLGVSNSMTLAGTDGTTLTFQGTDTYVGRATTDTLTNKTFDTAGTGNSFSINSLAATSNTGTGAVVRATSPTLTTPALGVATVTSLAINGAAIGSNALSVNGTTQLVGATTVTSASASALTVGLNGATNPAFQVDASAGTQATGVKITAAAAAGGVGIAAISSGANETIALNAKGTGQILIGNVSTGTVTITPNITHSGTTTLSAALTYGGVTFSNTTTGSGSLVGSASPTFTGTLAAAALTATTVNGNTITSSSGTLTLAAGKTLGVSNSITLAGTDSTTITFQGTDTYVGRATTDTLTNKTLGAVTLSGTVSGGGNNINNVNIGASSPGTGAFTTVTASTSLTSPSRYGGSATGSTALFNGTSNGTPSSAFVNIQSNGQFASIGNTSPKTYLDINQNLSSSPALVQSGVLQRLQAPDSTNGGTEWVTYNATAGAGNFLTGVIAAGTSGSPATSSNQMNMFNLSGWSYNGTAMAKGAIHTLRTDSQWSGTNQASAQDFYTTPTTSTTLTRAMVINPSGAVSIGSTPVESGTGTLNLKKQTFASLTACSSTIEGTIAAVTDSTTTIWAATITGGGSSHVLGYCDGTNWKVVGT